MGMPGTSPGRYTPEGTTPRRYTTLPGMYTPLVLTFNGGHQSRRYASYWNTFLFTIGITIYKSTTSYQCADDRVRDERDESTKLIEDSKQHQHDPQHLPHDPAGYLKQKTVQDDPHKIEQLPVQCEIIWGGVDTRPNEQRFQLSPST